MTKYCDSCHSANSDRAKYCCFCQGKFSGVRFGAHTSANPVSDSLPLRSGAPTHPAPPARRIRSTSPAMRAGLVLVFLVLLLGPFTHLNFTASPERRPTLKSSVVSAWERSAAVLTGTIKPLLAAAPSAQSAAPDADSLRTAKAEGAQPVDAPSSQAATRAARAAPTSRCTEAQAALSLCPKK